MSKIKKIKKYKKQAEKWKKKYYKLKHKTDMMRICALWEKTKEQSKRSSSW